MKRPNPPPEPEEIRAFSSPVSPLMRSRNFASPARTQRNETIPQVDSPQTYILYICIYYMYGHICVVWGA